MYLPGPPVPTGPLSRYLPPLADGMAAAWLARAGVPAGAWLIDPFGASPRLAVQAAGAGYRVLAAANNPIARFLIELHAAPPTPEELRLALVELSAAQKAGERLEPHLRALYRTPCAGCGQMVEAEAFIWEREQSAPAPPKLAARRYTCPHCQDSGEHPATPYDLEQAARFTAQGLHRARALERVAPGSDPDRAYAEEALDAYLPRAVYALFTLVNQLDRLPPARLRPAQALLLAAFDQGNLLWPEPPGRLRPRQLSSPNRFYEKNLWLALEDAAQEWPLALAAAGPAFCAAWPELPPESGGVCLFEGRLKRLETGLDFPPIAAVLTALPRPNQAFWTLSALWAGWLWGPEATAAFKAVLRRQRYDWAWHIEALYSALASLAQRLPPECPILAQVGEAEAGFVSAALLAAAGSGFTLHSLALRQPEALLQIGWRSPAATNPLPPLPKDAATLGKFLQAGAAAFLAERGEPATYLRLHSAVLRDLLTAYSLPASQSDDLVEWMQRIDKAVERSLNGSPRFVHYPPGARLVESGMWWLSEPPTPAALPLADRVEMEMVRRLQKEPGLTLDELDAQACAAFPGLHTPDLELVSEAAQSYADPAFLPGLRLNAADQPGARRRDLAEIGDLLRQTGQRLGFTVEDAPSKTTRSLAWRTGERTAFVFYPIASAILSPALLAAPLPEGAQGVIVLPGSRARLAAFKLRRDPRLPAVLESGWRLVKFRHLRRLAHDPTLTPASFAALLSGDPLENEDGQMTLF